MTPADLQHFITTRHMTRKRFGEEMGISQPTVRRLLDGRSKIPRCIQYALAAIANQLQPYGETL